MDTSLKEKLFLSTISIVGLFLLIGLPVIGGIYVLEYIKEQKYNVAYFGIYISTLYLLLYFWFPFLRLTEKRFNDKTKGLKGRLMNLHHYSLEDSLMFALPSLMLIFIIGNTTQAIGLLQSCGYIELEQITFLNIFFPNEFSNINLENCTNPATESILYIIMIYCVPFVPFISGIIIASVGYKLLYKDEEN